MGWMGWIPLHAVAHQRDVVIKRIAGLQDVLLRGQGNEGPRTGGRHGGSCQVSPLPVATAHKCGVWAGAEMRGRVHGLFVVCSNQTLTLIHALSFL